MQSSRVGLSTYQLVLILVVAVLVGSAGTFGVQRVVADRQAKAQTGTAITKLSARGFGSLTEEAAGELASPARAMSSGTVTTSGPAGSLSIATDGTAKEMAGAAVADSSGFMSYASTVYQAPAFDVPGGDLAVYRRSDASVPAADAFGLITGQLSFGKAGASTASGANFELGSGYSVSLQLESGDFTISRSSSDVNLKESTMMPDTVEGFGIVDQVALDVADSFVRQFGIRTKGLLAPVVLEDGTAPEERYSATVVYQESIDGWGVVDSLGNPVGLRLEITAADSAVSYVAGNFGRYQSSVYPAASKADVLSAVQQGQQYGYPLPEGTTTQKRTLGQPKQVLLEQYVASDKVLLVPALQFAVTDVEESWEVDTLVVPMIDELLKLRQSAVVMPYEGSLGSGGMPVPMPAIR